MRMTYPASFHRCDVGNRREILNGCRKEAGLGMRTTSRLRLFRVSGLSGRWMQGGERPARSHLPLHPGILSTDGGQVRREAWRLVARGISGWMEQGEAE